MCRDPIVNAWDEVFAMRRIRARNPLNAAVQLAGNNQSADVIKAERISRLEKRFDLTSRPLRTRVVTHQSSGDVQRVAQRRRVVDQMRTSRPELATYLGAHYHCPMFQQSSGIACCIRVSSPCADCGFTV